jgi:hypothetical protein
MKLRSWAIVSFMLLVALGSALYEIKLYLEKKRHLEALIVQAVSPYIKGSFTVGTVRFGFFSAHLKNVSISLPAQALAISVEDFTLKLSPLKFIRSGFSVTRSVEKIVLVRPLLEYSLAVAAAPDSGRAAAPAVKNAGGRSFGLQRLGIEYLLVKGGRLCLKDRTGVSMILGEDLAGRMRDTETELLYDLSGKLGAARKNLFVNGAVSWKGAKHRLSLRLRRAEIRRPISLKGGKLSSGVLSGALEFFFPDDITLATLECNGWIRIERGTCRIDRLERPLDSVDCLFSLNANRCSLDSLRLVYSCAHVKASGQWRLAAADSCDRLDFECSPLCFDSLALPLSKGVRRALTGRGWLTGTYFRSRGSDPFLTLCGGGIIAGGIPLNGFTAKVRLQHKLYVVDSLRLQSPGSNVMRTGLSTTAHRRSVIRSPVQAPSIRSRFFHLVFPGRPVFPEPCGDSGSKRTAISPSGHRRSLSQRCRSGMRRWLFTSGMNPYRLPRMAKIGTCHSLRGEGFAVHFPPLRRRDARYRRW